jgi:hypothetical protein
MKSSVRDGFIAEALTPTYSVALDWLKDLVMRGQ